MTEFVVWCETHKNYLEVVSVTGTSWREDPDDAKRWATKPAARAAAEKATWRDHRPVVWAVPSRCPRCLHPAHDGMCQDGTVCDCVV